MKLSTFDKLILLELDKNARASFSSIGKTIQRSPQFVKYRFEKLIENKTINFLYTAIDPSNLGYRTINYFIKLQGIGLQQEQEMLDYLFKHSMINKIYRMEGYYDYFISFCAKNLEEFENLLNDIYARFSSFFLKFDNVNEIVSEYYDKNYLLDRKKETVIKKKELISEDARQVLSALIMNPKVQLIDLAHNFSLEKTKKLLVECTKGVDRFSFILNPKVIYQHILLLQFKNFSDESARKLRYFSNLHPNITKYTRAFGSWDAMIHIEIEDRDEFRRLAKEITYRFEEIIKNSESCYIFKIDKYKTMPIEYPFQ